MLFASNLFANKIVRVRLQANQKTALVSGDIVSIAEKNSVLPIIISRKNEIISLTYKKDRENRFWKISNGRINHRSNSRILRISGKNVFIDGKPVPQEVLFYVKHSSAFDVIAVMDLEQYLEGVLPAEMPVSWPVEAVKAQAVASRSYAVARIEQNRGEPYHLEGTILDQVFTWNKSDLSEEHIRKLKRIIKQTRGLVLTKSRGKAIPAFFHSDCGGHTEEPSKVWGFGPKIGTTPDRYCKTRPTNKWDYFITADRLEKVFQNYLHTDEKLVRIHINSRSKSGRIEEIGLQLGNTDYPISANLFRKIIGYSKIKSTHFVFDTHENRYHFFGRGHGHGVGLCQWGSRRWAKKGWSFRKILSHYYPRTRIKRL